MSLDIAALEVRIDAMNSALILLKSQRCNDAILIHELMDDRKSIIRTGLMVLGGIVVALVSYIWGTRG